MSTLRPQWCALVPCGMRGLGELTTEGVGGFSASLGWMVFGKDGSASAMSGVKTINQLWLSITVDESEYYLFI